MMAILYSSSQGPASLRIILDRTHHPYIVCQSYSPGNSYGMSNNRVPGLTLLKWLG